MKTKSKKIVIASLAVAIIAVVAIVFFMTSGSSTTVYAEHLELSQKYLDELEYDLAIAELEKAIELEPKKVEAYIALADIYMEMGESDKAEEILQQAAKVMAEAELQSEAAKIDEHMKMVQTEMEAKNSESGDTNTIASNMDTKSQETAKNESANAKETAEETQTVEETVQNLARTETIYLEKGRYYVDEYNELGLKVKRSEYNKVGTLKNWQEYEYDADGKKVRRLYYKANGSIDNWLIYEYDTDGKLVRGLAYEDEALTQLSFVNEYGADGKVSKRINYLKSGVACEWLTYEYDAEKKLLKHYEYNDEQLSMVRYMIEYDNDEDVIEQTGYNVNGYVKDVVEYQYNENGDWCSYTGNGGEYIVYLDVYEQKTYECGYDGGELDYYLVYEYDEAGELVKNYQYTDETCTVLEYLHEYNENEQFSKETGYDETGNISYTFEYAYDENGILTHGNGSNGWSQWTLEFDKDGNKVKETGTYGVVYDYSVPVARDCGPYYILFEYNEMGNKVRETFYSAGWQGEDYILEYVEEYDSNGRAIKIDYYDYEGEGKVRFTYTYEYDVDGNWSNPPW